MSVFSQNSLEKPCICFDAADAIIRRVYFAAGEQIQYWAFYLLPKVFKFVKTFFEIKQHVFSLTKNEMSS